MHDEEETLYVDVPRSEPAVMSGPRVVVAVDGSAGSKAALRFGLEDAARRGVPVEAVIAYRVPESWADVDVIGSPEVERLRNTLRSQHEDRVRAVVDEVAGGLAGPLPDARTRAAEGSPADVLIRGSHGADLLVVGSRGHGGFHHAARLDEHPVCDARHLPGHRGALDRGPQPPAASAPRAAGRAT